MQLSARNAGNLIRFGVVPDGIIAEHSVSLIDKETGS